MADELSFRIELKRDAHFQLNATASIPLIGVTAISGPSGSGKTTLLRCLAGLESPDHSTIRFGDAIWEDAKMLPPEQRRIGFVFQTPTLFPHLNAEENILYGGERRGQANIDPVVKSLDLAPLLGRNVASLSGGEMRRVALARAIVSNPRVLFLDEPLVGLDERKKEELFTYIARAVNDASVPAIYVTHARDEITTLADRVLGMVNGRISGWLAAPLRLKATVVGVEGEAMKVLLDGAKADETDAIFSCPAMARVGERVGIGFQEGGYFLSPDRSQMSNAIITLPCRYTVEEQGTFSVFDQKIDLSWPATSKPPEHSWLSLLRVFTRPEPADSL